jgi:hypothetical protein
LYKDLPYVSLLNLAFLRNSSNQTLQKQDINSAEMKISSAILVFLAGFTFAHPAADVDSAPVQVLHLERDSTAHPAIGLEHIQVRAPTSDSTVDSVADSEPINIRAPSSDALAFTSAELEVIKQKAADSPFAVAALDPECVRCIRRNCTRAALCLALIVAPEVIACLLTFCAAASALCCAF